ncbi:HAMP domain-containing histidine kinase [Mucilaginibacter sp. UR6-1]|uniref:sensor histidine kinase n=1 Tax=Mucilaginibacter sp. UR6-1 TaxID=1435643 RepID=UPI001E5C69AD|nr:HAMP domain-containing sensor histidine kinase [Mucilaginibacter sp. UR6-1]MCC8410056.1 HAMP domain-containing histidine kinase [Mucilaginibacter sp. UR6-1]
MPNKLPALIGRLIGERTAFVLEQRIFHTICTVTLLALFLNTIVNYFLDMPYLAMLMVAGIALVSIAYYLSRYRRLFSSSIVIYNIFSNCLLIANFFNNSGTQGPTMLIFLLACFINISVVPKKQYWFWISINIIIMLTLIGLEYFDADLAPVSYPDRESRFIDMMYSYLVIAIIISIVTTYVRRSYNFERLQVEHKADELEQANITKNKLFSILAHDLRAPLSSIQNYLEILSELKLDESERMSIKKELLNTTQNTQKMLSNLLMWTKSQMEGVTVNLATVKLSDVLQTTLQIQKNEAQHKGITLVNNLQDDALVVADPDMLQLIVRNLVNNAIKFSKTGGEIEVRSAYEDGECCISIIDKGIGIPAEQQAEVFSIRGRSTYGTRNEKGVGLGLLLCKEFAELQGGKIWFSSEPGKGTTFCLGLKVHSGDSFIKSDLQAAANVN